MADSAKPSEKVEASSPGPSQEQQSRPEKPEKPDEEQFRVDVAKAEKDHAAVMDRLNAVKAKIDLARPSTKGSPAQQRQQELRAQLNTIRQQQQQLKSSKGNVREKIEQLDASLKSRIAEQKTARSRVPYKNVEEIDRQIERLEKQVDTGTMKLVDEKKALAEVSSLRKQRKGFGQFDQAEKGIADTKAQLTDLRKSLEDPEAKSLSERYTAVAKEWEDVKAQQDEAYKSINSLRDEKTKLQAEQQETYSAIRSIKNKYYAQKKAYSDYEHEAYKARRERQKAQREIIEREKRKKVADQRLEEASRPAYLDQILSAEGLIRFFDKSATNDTTTPTEPSKFAAPALRTIDESDFKGTKVLRKDDREENYFVGGGGKKGKKGKKNGGTASATSGTGAETGAVAGKFNLSVGVIEELGALNIEPPMSQADVPGVVEKLKAKVETWKKDQDRQTKANIDKAQKEIDRLEKEGLDATAVDADGSTSNGRKPATAPSSADGAPTKPTAASVDGAGTDATVPSKGAGADDDPAAELKAQNDAAADAAEELEKAKIEDQA
ncbi:MAG: hypothetical protein M1815_005423 [Lichina confinis]|nr:MAG: hypothetical protein M1815_005423 [Lichina confinis]